MTSFTLMLIYILLVITVLYRIKVWEPNYLKDTIIWSLFVALPLHFRVYRALNDDLWFRNTIRECIKTTVLVEYFINLYVFDFGTELILFPVLCGIGVISAFVENNEDYKAIRSLIDKILAVLGLGLVIFVSAQIYNDIQSLVSIRTIKTILFQPLLSILFLPCLYGNALVMSYETLFVRMSFRIRDPELLAFAKRKIIRRCEVSLVKLNNCSRQLFRRSLDSRPDIVKYVNDTAGTNLNKSI